MTPEHWKRIDEIFSRVIDLPAAERQAALASECGSDDVLRSEVERLLQSDESAGDFIESPIWSDSKFLNTSAKEKLSSFGDGPAAEADTLIGSMVGPFRLISEIGRGGMGAVYLAERADGEFRQKVAIKVIKRGMDSDFIVRRFRHERQILASFEHPFIARLLDGGTRDDGTPYFVMEYIEGRSLYQYCDESKLTIRERLKIFQKICSAIAYAHQRQIVHRDIKPTNILMRRDGTPKLLDFGIAKILDPNLIHESLNPTASMLRMMTPDYASPEQVRGEDVTPASDIYSLGVLLYELLSGHRPFMFAGKALHEITFAICESDPPVPSSQIGSREMLHSRYAGSEDAVYQGRATTGHELRNALSGDLDNVIMKAMAKDPANRYQDVSELINDISNVLALRPAAAPAFQPGNRQPAPKQARQVKDDLKGLAVLPFKFINLGAGEDTDDQFLGLALTDALISRLSKVKRFLVRPTSSILAIGERVSDPISAGNELGVDFILDGTIKKAANRLRVSVQLLDVKRNSAVWATSIDETVGDLLALEDSISSKVIDGLVPQLTGSELARLARRGTEVNEAFEHYIRGRYHFSTFTEDGLAKAFLSFHNAIAADPNYAAAYSGLADYYNWLGIIGVLPPQECFQPAIIAAGKAVELDPDLSEAHASLGFSLHAGNYDWEGAERHLQKAIHLNPANASAFVWQAIVLYTKGRFDEGLGYARRGVDLDPLAPFNHHNVGWGLYFARRFDEAISQYRRVTRDFPDYAFGFYGLSKVHRAVGDTDAALYENAKALQLMGDSIFGRLAHVECLAAAGSTGEAREQLSALIELGAERYVSPYQIALAYAYLSKSGGPEDSQKALQHLKAAFEVKDAWLNYLGIEPAFDGLRDSQEYADLIEKVGYADLLGKRSSGRDAETGPMIHSSLHDRTTLVVDEADITQDTETPVKITKTQWKLLGAAATAVLCVFAFVVYMTYQNTRAVADPRLRPTSFQQPAIIVLPFATDDGYDSNVGVGMADSLSHRLGSIKGIRVLSANTGRSLSTADPLASAWEIGASFLIRGHLSRSDDRVFVSTDLLDVGRQEIFWSETFEAADGDLFDLQTDIARKVWESLDLRPLPDELRQLEKQYTQSFSVYEKYLVGRSQMTKRDAASLRQAIASFGEAVAEDAAFAPAYVGLADCYSLLNLYDVDPPKDAFSTALKHAERALQIDSELADAHASLAYIRFYGERDRQSAELEFRRAIQMNPSYSQAHHWFALALAAMDKHVDALTEIQTAEGLDPRSASIRSAAAMVYFYGGKQNEAIAHLDQTLAKQPDFIPALKVKRWALAARGDYAAARETLEIERTASGGSADDPGWQIIALQLADSDGSDRTALLNKLEKAIAHSGVKGNDFGYAFEIALAFHHLGADDKALEWLGRADRAGNHSFNFLAVDPRLSSLHNTDGFRTLLQSLKTPLHSAAAASN